VPLSFWWDGDNIWIATPRASATGRNLEALESVRLAFGTFRDVVLVHGSVDVTPDAEISAEIGDQFAAKAGFDPRLSEQDYGYFRIRPIRIQAWHEEPELSGRTIMTNGEWRHE
jgi:hypothetical protein